MYVCDYGYSSDIYQEELNKILSSEEVQYIEPEYLEGDDVVSTTKYGFTKMTATEFKTWITKQGNYKYTGIQIHHTAAPSYSNFYKSNGTHEDELVRQNNIKYYHVKTNGWGDIAQHFTIFPNGAIVTGRKLSNTTAIGIKGWNSNKICIEIYGNFDKGKDVMTKEQKEAVITVYGELCKKFKITPSVSTIRCHAWFTAGGTYLGDYNKSKSAKTCPGTNFMGFGNSKAAIRDNFIPLIKNYISGKDTATVPSKPVSTNPVAANFKVKVTADELNYREKPDASSKKLGEVKKGEVYTIVKTQNGWGFLKSGAGWINLSYTETIEVSSNGTYKVKVTTSSLNIRKGPGASYAKVGAVSKGEVFTIVETQSGWGKLKSGLGWISLAYTEKVK